MRGAIVLLLIVTNSFAQRVCKRPALAALKPIPELSYPCDDQLNDYDEKTLKLPARLTAIKTLKSQLSAFSDTAWWSTDIVDLGVCDYTKKPGPLTPDQRHSFLDGEVSTGSGGLTPSLTNYYFAIDPNTHQAVPKNLFTGDHGPTNEISSAMLLSDSRRAYEPLKAIQGQTLARSFIIYVDDANGKIDDNGRTLSRKVLRWNGKVFR